MFLRWLSKVGRLFHITIQAQFGDGLVRADRDRTDDVMFLLVLVTFLRQFHSQIVSGLQEHRE